MKIDDSIRTPRWQGMRPLLTDSELVCLAVAQVPPSARSEAHWIRYARIHLPLGFPCLPQLPGYNNRLRAALPLIKKAIRALAHDSDYWFGDHWIVDSASVPCGMSRPTVQLSDLAGWAGYGYRTSHSRFFWGLRLYLVYLTGMPILWALVNPKLGEREVLAAMLEVEAGVVAEHPGILLISHKGFAFTAFERHLVEPGHRPAPAVTQGADEAHPEAGSEPALPSSAVRYVGADR